MQQGRQMEIGTNASGTEGPAFGQLVLRRKWLLLFGLAVGVGLGYLYFTQQAPVYRSDARVLVTRPHEPMATDGSRPQSASAADILETQCLVVTSQAVVGAAVDKYGLAKLPEFGSREAAISRVVVGLAAVPARKQTEVMDISYLGSTPAETRAVVDAIIKAYRDFLGDTEQATSAELAGLITQAKDELLKDLEKLEAEYAKFRSEAPLLWQGEQGINPHAERLASIEAQQSALLLEKSQLQAKVDAVRGALAAGGSREALALMLSQLREEDAPKSEAGTIAEKLFPLLLEKELAAEKFGREHPKVKSIQKQIELTQSHLNGLFEGNGTARPRDLLDVYLDSLIYEIQVVDTQRTQLGLVFDDENKESQRLDEFLIRDGQLRQDIAKKRQLFDAVVKRLEETSLFENKGMKTTLIAVPGLGWRTSFARNRYMGVGAVVGLLVAVGIAYLLEVNDRSFRSPEDIRDEVGAAVIGHVPVISSTAVEPGLKAAPALCTVHTPKSSTSEAFRLIRTALFFGARGGNLKVIQVSSPDQGDGKSTTSGNLSVAIAQSGRRTLLIDADMRRPTLHRLFGLGNEVGLSAVIGQGLDPVEAIQETEVANLSVLSCGARPHNPAELLASQEFENFLGWARDRYDFVIIDTPPLLAVSDPGNVASRVDGVLLTLRLGKRTRSKAAEAREILDRFGANLLGVVINGVNARGEYGYRSSYGRSYSNGYGYRYGSTYTSYATGNGYLEDSARPSSPRAAANGHGPREHVAG